MQVQKLRASTHGNGLVPAGRYFEQLTRSLRDVSVKDAARCGKLDARYPRASASRGNTFAPESHPAL